MSGPDPLDPYELLELPRGASRDEVERAYRLAVETWAEDSLAGYSVVSAAEAAVLRRRVRDAYHTLVDDGARTAYEAAAASEVPDAAPQAPAEGVPPADDAFDELESGESEWSGARLRRHRLHRGREIDDISAITKINPHYLHCIEEERFSELPARVYVRGFVYSFAACLGLDAEVVAHGYTKRFEAGRPAPRRRRSR